MRFTEGKWRQGRWLQEAGMRLTRDREESNMRLVNWRPRRRKVFSPGKTIYGRAILTVDCDIKVRSINIFCCGMDSIKWRSGHASCTGCDSVIMHDVLMKVVMLLALGVIQSSCMRCLGEGGHASCTGCDSVIMHDVLGKAVMLLALGVIQSSCMKSWGRRSCFLHWV
ncbi:hypothetical protein Btru_038375 [Bulinus truncatus]|nr:hypothetical protein Btru_038375 [Bulinus truncatus]